MIIRDEDMNGMTLHNYIDRIKMKGTVLVSGILQLQNDKYAEIAIIKFEDNYYVGWVILDTYIERVYDVYFEVFHRYNEALSFYNSLGDLLNGTRYE
ncbi:hypothetical protein G7A72_10015 [Flavobacterium sp. Sr18]|uniref:hypothetical protein n=1 Tax=Flavobacterium sp. Sr18 TaxID=935222 RepID=UPI0013E48885|nr:hypothetical protein [Flavobacterium sp. Sr18]QIH39121.1 hypothetical protein G7A72_10015 [Flavobacterium sp. Sr18]